MEPAPSRLSSTYGPTRSGSGRRSGCSCGGFGSTGSDRAGTGTIMPTRSRPDRPVGATSPHCVGGRAGLGAADPGRTAPRAPIEEEPSVSAVPTIPLNNGVEIPQLGFGVFQIEPARTTEATLAALE